MEIRKRERRGAMEAPLAGNRRRDVGRLGEAVGLPGASCPRRFLRNSHRRIGRPAASRCGAAIPRFRSAAFNRYKQGESGIRRIRARLRWQRFESDRPGIVAIALERSGQYPEL
jgi:hypothetical protein